MDTSSPKRSSATDPNWATSRAKVLHARDAARFVGLSESTLAKLRLNGNGPLYCKLGRRVLYRPTDLEEWLDSRITRDTSDADARFLKALAAERRR
jgi:predicted DNA-binding transcriptional regulator AlpA